MTPAVKRRRKVQVPQELELVDGAWGDVLEQCARKLQHGTCAVVHEKNCPGMNPAGICDCRCILIGAAVRDWWQ